MKPRRPPPARRPYEPPRLRRFELKAPEVLAPGCKMSAGGGSGPAPPGCLPGGCFQSGS